MVKIIFKKVTGAIYSAQVSETDGELWVLGNFLTDDVRTDTQFASDWLSNPDITATSFNFASLKFENNIASVGCEFLDDFPRLRLPRQTLIDIAIEWVKTVRTQKPYIILALHDDGSFEFSTSQTKPKE